MRARVWTAAMITLMALGAAGCSTAHPADLPEGAGISVHQNRPDTEDRRLQVRITNDSAEEFTITSLVFASARFAEPTLYAKVPTVIRPARTVDLPVLLPEPNCEDASVNAQPRVTIEFELSDGRTGAVKVVPRDPLTQLDGISERDCLSFAIAEIAEITPPHSIRIDRSGDRPVALVDLAVTPTGSPAAFTIDAVDDTVLFALYDVGGAAVLDTLPLDVRVSGLDPARMLTIALVPARCDAHAVAEDKRGTLLPLRVTIDGHAGMLYLAMGETVKGQLYDYLNEACSER